MPRGPRRAQLGANILDAAAQKKQEKQENFKSCFQLLPACQNVCTRWASLYPEVSSGNGTTWDNVRARMLQCRAWSIPGAALVSGQEHAPEDALSNTNNGCSLGPAATGDFSLVEVLPCLIDAFSPIIKQCLLTSSKCSLQASPSGPARVPSGGHVPHVFGTVHTFTCCRI